MPVSNRHEQKTRNAFLEDWRETEERAVVSLLYSVVVGTTDENGEATPQSKTVMLDFINKTGGKNPFSALHGGRDHSAIWTALASLAVNEAVIAIDTQNLMERLQATDWTAKDIIALLDCSDQIRYGTASFKTYVDALQDFKNRQKIADQAAELARNAINRSLPLENWITPVKQAVTQDISTGQELRPLSLEEMMEKYNEESEKLFPWLCRQDVCLVHGAPGLGKTWLTLSMACSLASGAGKACGIWEPYGAHKVVIIDGEMRCYDLHKRIAFLAQVQGSPLEVIQKNLAVFSWQEMQIELPSKGIEAYVKKNNVALVLLDNISCLFGLKEENDNAEVNKTVRPITSAFQKAGAACVVVHHSKKESGQDKEEPTPRGASALTGLADSVLALKRPRAFYPGVSFEIINQKMRRGAMQEKIHVQIGYDADGKQSWQAAGQEKSRAEKAREMIAQGMSDAEVAAGAGVSVQFVNQERKRERKKLVEGDKKRARKS